MEPITVTLVDSQTILGMKSLGIAECIWLYLTVFCMRCWFLAALSNSHKLLMDVETPVEQCAACET